MKKKLLLLTHLLVSFTFLSSAQTNISGGINEDSTWTIQGSPYIITGNTVVFDDNTLTIEPGVIVKFDNDVQLRLQGSLIAIGNADNKIVFTSNDPNPKRGSWDEINIEFRGTFILDYVQMEYANNALRYNHVISSSIKNSIFQFNNNGINVSSGSPQWAVAIETTKFLNNDKGIANFHDEVSLIDCEFKNNRIGAELVESNLDSCLFEGNTDIAFYGTSSEIKNSTFVNNGIALNKHFSSGFYTSIVTGNTFKSNYLAVKILSFSDGAIFSDNIICDNYTYNVENTKSRGADFSNNCWCTDNLDEIENSIFHGLDDINLGVVTFTPTTTTCIDPTLNADDFFESKQTNLFFPNPVVSNLNFVNDLNKVYEIYSMNGVLVKKGITTTKINLSDLNTGFYLIKLEIENQSKSMINTLVKK